MIPPTGSAAAVVTHSRKKPLSMCFERAWMSMYPNPFRDEFSQLARFRGGVDPSTVRSAVDVNEPAEPGEVANGNSCEPVGSDPRPLFAQSLLIRKHRVSCCDLFAKLIQYLIYALT
jgi:hypothetical protein